MSNDPTFRDDTISGIREYCEATGQPCESLQSVFLIVRANRDAVGTWLAPDTNEQWIAAAIAGIYSEAMRRDAVDAETLQQATMQAMMKVAEQFQNEQTKPV